MVQGIDHAALRERYRIERDKRLRADGNDQYIEPTGRFAHLLEDPYVAVVERAPRDEEVDVACVGAGFSGLVMGAALKKVGIERVCLIDKAGDVGGVWYWNRYPGAMCDTASMIYLPLLEETGYMPSQKYTMGTENHQHAQRIARHFGLYDDALLSTGVTKLAWDDQAARWNIFTDRGDTIRARYVTLGTGPLHRPKLPGIPGIERFGGHTFHTSRWDYDYTGGSPAGDLMENLADKRVGIIGTGATGVQCIPHVGRAAQELFVFQRTPSSVDERNNHPIDDDWFSTLAPGWQEQWRMNFTVLQTGGFADEDLVKDGWTDISQRIRDRVVDMLDDEPGDDIFRRAYEDSDDEKMTEIRARVDALVDDPEIAEQLKPWYRQLCKRPCFHDEYLDVYNRSNVHLVDTDGKGVTEIDDTGVWVGDTHYDLDCLIFASGFEVGTSSLRRWGFDLEGRDGRKLSDHWVDGMRTMHGIHINGFPNAFIVGMSQGANLVSNIPHNLTDAAETISTIIAYAESKNVRTVEVTAEAENAWMDVLGDTGTGLIGGPDCTPGYYNNEGQDLGRRDGITAQGYPGGPVAFFNLIDEWRKAGTFDGLSMVGV